MTRRGFFTGLAAFCTVLGLPKAAKAMRPPAAPDGPTGPTVSMSKLYEYLEAHYPMGKGFQFLYVSPALQFAIANTYRLERVILNSVRYDLPEGGRVEGLHIMGRGIIAASSFDDRAIRIAMGYCA